MIAMAEDVIDFTRERFNRAGAKLDRVLDALEQVTMRLSSLEEQVSIQRREIGPMREDFIRLEHRIDGMDRRPARIEKRLHLAGLEPDLLQQHNTRKF